VSVYLLNLVNVALGVVDPTLDLNFESTENTELVIRLLY
jgi:hypothetical protein